MERVGVGNLRFHQIEVYASFLAWPWLTVRSAAACKQIEETPYKARSHRGGRIDADLRVCEAAGDTGPDGEEPLPFPPQHDIAQDGHLAEDRGSCTCILRVIPNARESGTIPPFSTCARGHCHDIQPRFLPARAHRPGVVVSDTLWPLAIGACCSSPHAPQAAAAPMQALPKAQALSRSHP